LHLLRIMLAPLVALATWLAFPRAHARLPLRLEPGSVAAADVISPVRFLVLKPEAERAREAEALAATVRAVVSERPAAAAAAAASASRFFASLDSVAASGGSVEEVARRVGLSLTDRELALLASGGKRAALRRAAVEALEKSSRGFLASGVSLDDLGEEIVLRRGAEERVVPTRGTLRSFGEFLDFATTLQPRPTLEYDERLFLRLVGVFYRPTLGYEREETERRRDALRRSVDSVVTVVQAGEKIVGAHEVVTVEAALKLQALREELEGRTGERMGSLTASLGALGLDLLIVALFGIICAFYRPAIYRSLPSMLVLSAGFLVVVLAAAAVARSAPQRVDLIPVALPAILFSVLFDGRIAAVAAMVIAALVGGQPSLAGTDALFFCFVGGVAAALSVRRIRRRTQAYTSIGVVAALYAGAAMVAGAASGESLREIGVSAGLGGVNALGSAALAMLVLPLAETVTHTTTDLRLLELSDPSHPLLRRLATEAPGTYAHSVAMANLCEAACNAIGANGLLARVGCYYHDVGKLKHPQYFVENQGRGRNPHQQLTPAQSAAVIRAHVEEGLALAEAHRLPQAIKSFIPEHHGTQPISYFLERARGEASTSSLREEDFRYPGPTPRSAETAVALLADAVEAALRVLDDPTPEQIEDAIHHLIESRVASGQLRDAPLTLRQLETVRREFLHLLRGMYHNRVEYPEESGGITADWEASRAG
jgi:putative nucleotidyltransferase with HDIG domain